ncbi:sulfatase-like hydrolase/transferase [bacterium]|nr:sulfatase-like hydrolase/transferase [bacterium]
MCHAQNKQPNFIIFIADDMAWNDAGCYGHPHIRTPNIDRLAKEGLTFTSAFLTCSSCSPSRSSIMTGRYPHATGAQNLHDPLPANQVVFAGLLKEAGYYTASAGKWHLGNAAKKNFDTIHMGGGPSGCEHWERTLQERPKDKPFFLWLAAIDPHRGYQENAISNPHKPEDAVVPPFLPDNEATRKDLALYYDEIARMDSYIGKVLDELEKQGEADNTFVLFMSDNGRPFPRCKTLTYDSGVKTPFIVRFPKQTQAGTECGSLVSSIDIAPTILELAGLKRSPTFQGKSFAKMLANTNTETRKYIFAEHNWHDYKAHERTARSKKYLYLHNAFPELPHTPPADAVRSMTYQRMIELHEEGKLNRAQSHCFIQPRPAEELYDVQKDPYMLHNLAQDPAYKEALDEMRVVYQTWKQETNDKVPENPRPDQFHRTTGQRLKK